MKRFILFTALLSGCLCQAAAATDDLQLLQGSQATEGNTYTDGGKVVTVSRRAYAGSNVTLRATGGAAGVSYPSITWYNAGGEQVQAPSATGAGTDSPVSQWSCYKFTAASQFSGATYYAATRMSGTQAAADGPAAYTTRFDVASYSGDNNILTHTVVTPPNTTVSLYPYYRDLYDYYYEKIPLWFTTETHTPTSFAYQADGGAAQAANRGWHAASSLGSDTKSYYTGYGAVSPAAGQASSVTCQVNYDVSWYSSSTAEQEVETWNITSVASAPAFTDTLYTNGLEGYSATGTGFGKNSVTGEYASDYGLSQEAASYALPGEYALFNGTMRGIAPRKGSHAAFFGPSDQTQRLFHFTVDSENGTRFSANDSLCAGGWFLTRLAGETSRSVRIVVTDYTGNTRGDEIITYLSGEIGLTYERQAVAFRVPSGCTSLLVEIYNNTVDATLDGDDLYMDDLFVTREEKTYFFTDGFYKISDGSGGYLTASATSTSEGDTYDGSDFWYIRYNGNPSGNLHEYTFINMKGEIRNYLSNSAYNGSLRFGTDSASLQTSMSVDDYPSGYGSSLFLWMQANSGALSPQATAGSEWTLEAMPDLTVQPAPYLQTYVIYEPATRTNLTSIDVPLRVSDSVLAHLHSADDLEFVFPGGDRPEWLTIELNTAEKKLTLSSSAADGQMQAGVLEFYVVNKQYPLVRAINASKVTSTPCRLTLIARPPRERWAHVLSINGTSGETMYLDLKKQGDDIIPYMTTGNSDRQTQDWMNVSIGTHYLLLNANGMVITRSGSGAVMAKYEAGNENQLWDMQQENAYILYFLNNEGDYVNYDNDNGFSYDPDSKTIFYAIASNYAYTIRVPQGQKGFDLYYYKAKAIKELQVKSESLGYSHTFTEFPEVSGSHAVLSLPDTDGLISSLPVGTYSFTAIITPAESDCPCNVQEIALRLVITPDTLTWNGTTTDWITDNAWKEGVLPLSSTNVVIPGDAALYPALMDSTEYLTRGGIPFRDQHFRLQPSARGVHFDDGARMGRTDLLNYDNASYDISSVKVKNWYGMASPLHATYSSDYTFRYMNPLTEMRVFNYDPATYGTPDKADWSRSFTNGAVSLADRGFALRVAPLYYSGLDWEGDEATAYGELSGKTVLAEGQAIPYTLSMPQSRTEFHHRDDATKKPTGYTEYLDRSLIGRFVYENADRSVPSGTLKTIAIADNVNEGDYVMLPNIFMSDLDLAAFFEANSDVLENKFYLLSGVRPVCTLYQYNTATGEYLSSDRSTSLPGYLAPLQSFIAVAKANAAGKSVNYTAAMSTVNTPTRPSLRRASASADEVCMVISVSNGGATSGASLVYDPAADTAYLPAEDGRLLLATGTGADAPAVAFAQGGNFLAINRTSSVPAIQPLYTMAPRKGEATLSITGADLLAEELDTELYLVDRQTGTRAALVDSVYSYTYASSGDDATDRFVIAAGRSGDGATNLDETASDASGITVYTAGGYAYVNTYGSTLRGVSLLSTVGRNLPAAIIGLTSSHAEVSLPADPVLLLRVETDKEVKVVKIMR